ncbi:MAG: hypothetical protein R3E01_04185 [Pirellulaceae bacterium]
MKQKTSVIGHAQLEQNGGDGLAKDEWALRLRDGTQMDGRDAAATHRFLIAQFKHNRPMLEMMFDYVQGKRELSEDFRVQEAYAETSGILTPDGDLPERMKHLLRNGFERIDGELLPVNPFANDSWTRTVVNTIVENRPIFDERLRQEIREARQRRDGGTDEPKRPLR